MKPVADAHHRCRFALWFELGYLGAVSLLLISADLGPGLEHGESVIPVTFAWNSVAGGVPGWVKRLGLFWFAKVATSSYMSLVSSELACALCLPLRASSVSVLSLCSCPSAGRGVSRVGDAQCASAYKLPKLSLSISPHHHTTSPATYTIGPPAATPSTHLTTASFFLPSSRTCSLPRSPKARSKLRAGNRRLWKLGVAPVRRYFPRFRALQNPRSRCQTTAL